MLEIIFHIKTQTRTDERFTSFAANAVQTQNIAAKAFGPTSTELQNCYNQIMTSVKNEPKIKNQFQFGASHSVEITDKIIIYKLKKLKGSQDKKVKLATITYNLENDLSGSNKG